ncbi:MAG: FAD-binding oxidoreductase [Chloroflexi bacterium]|nr:FAD-binding oxidoreductase [Chloroflexota bacterium]
MPSESANSANVVVIGGGVIGSSIAMHLAQMGAGKVILLEKEHLASGATGRSGAMIREHYLHPTLVKMAQESSQVFHNFDEIIGGDVRFIQTGRIILLPDGDVAAGRANVAMNRELGVNIQTLTPAEIVRLVPQMSTDGVALGLYEPNSGYADSVATTHAFARQAEARGATILTGCRATGFKVVGGRLAGVETESGIIETDAAVVAAGPWTNWLAAPLGEFLPITPLRVQMVHLRRPPALESFTPTVIDQTNGAYFRLNAGFYTLMGGEAPEDMGEVVNPDAYGLNAEHDTIIRYWQRARLRFPDFAATTPQGGYGSLYDMTPDGNPILDRAQSVDGLFWAAGFSGHGFKLSPVIGRMMADLVIHGDSMGHELKGFRAARFSDSLARGDSLAPEHPYQARSHP